MISSRITTVNECIHVDHNFHVKLSYVYQIPLPEYIDRAEGSKLTSLDLLTNLPVYCRNVEATCKTNIISELLKSQNYYLNEDPILHYCIEICSYHDIHF